jgi:1,4-alpha-glucan branching enzyme
VPNFHGSYILVLHTHMPWVMYHEDLEVEWLLEAAAETYIPLLDVMRRLVDEGISPKVTFTMSPVLAEQLSLDHFKERFIAYCAKKAEAARKDRDDFERDQPHLSFLASRWEQYYEQIARSFIETYKQDLIGAFKALQDAGHIEIMTCGATHAYFPAAAEDTSIQAQVRTAVDSHIKHFGSQPKGLWLPECGYRPACRWAPRVGSKWGEIPYPRKGVEEFLSEADVRYFVVDNNQLMKSHPNDFPKDPFFAYWARGSQTPKEPVAVFARDIPLSLQVWRHEIGYPGDGVYLDFHKRHNEGRLRYWKITHNKADMAYKDYYYPDDALDQKVLEHAGNYKLLIAASLKNHFEQTGAASMALTAFDTELYGHWWFEGPQFIYHLIKWVNQDPEIRTETCSEFLDRIPPRGDVFMPESSWGAGYDSSTWINDEIAWVLDRDYDAERDMQALAREFFFTQDPELTKILKQCSRELMLLMSSDWKFMITNWSTRDHAERRVMQHFNDFKRLAKMARDYGHGEWVDQGEWIFLGDCMARNRPFQDVDFKWFANPSMPANC